VTSATHDNPSAPTWRDSLRRVLDADTAGVCLARLGADEPATPLRFEASLDCWLKCDHQGPFSTHKRRGLGVQLAMAMATGHLRGCTVSSSGNAAVALGGWVSRLGVPGLAFLSHKTPTAKIAAVVSTGIHTAVTEKPKNFSRYAARFGRLVDLRPSRDPTGSWGYRTLAPELLDALDPGPTDIFCFVNSGLTVVGLADGVEALIRRQELSPGARPALHAVQCSPRTELARATGSPERPQADPLAGPLGARVPPDLPAVAGAVRRTGGSVWMVDNDEVRAARRQLSEANYAVALESAAALAGLLRARQAHAVGAVCVVLLAGPEWTCRDSRQQVLEGVERPRDYGDVRRWLERLGLGRGTEGDWPSG
jgi:threonine dehydratase